MRQSLTDPYGRTFSYIRLSITDRCNFKCHYCLPNGYQCTPGQEKHLELEEIKRLINGLDDLGVTKIRITGGEPTLRPDFLKIAEYIASKPHIKTVALTTNGFRLKQRIQSYYDAGINHLNVSIDSLDPATFTAVTQMRGLEGIFEGLAMALELPFSHVKINTVLLRGINDQSLNEFTEWIKHRPISLRFIELMRAADNKEYFEAHHVHASNVKNQLLEQGWSIKPREKNAGPAVELTHPSYEGRIGFIAPYSKDFCSTCNRLRITSRGELRLCLFGNENHSLRPHLQKDEDKDQLIAKIHKLLNIKERSHHLQEGKYGITKHFASIGG
ncbi:MAG: GTP 3',8-cyclase MoaA [Oligoflexales bacterium]|nr:GTP 3',8-cyclase MoaA [Oligoflexales bacterium]